MGWEMSSSWCPSWAVEQAREELEVLESMYPYRFEYLKLELKSFINSAEEEEDEQELKHHHNKNSNSSSISISTQASCNRKRKSSRDGEMVAVVNKKYRKLNHNNVDGAKGKVETAMERAEACLRKIREVKRSFTDA
ncbi:hypothetical protein Scep_015950 [Stephania cephalantha]|uniref:Uncharacterized protein n=1 Tax=Stephania cephalantha TaxID=152367 RepID=A0AAP0INL9_9MAGN